MDYKDMNAIGIVRLMLTDGVITEEQAAKYFPELKESEGERIRKWCISHFKECINVIKDNDEYKEYLSNKVLAWLEKQGEQKPADTEKGAKGNDREIPNSAWSEEDEKMWLQVINEIEAIKFNSSTLFEKNIAQDKIDFLKSLKDRYTWQPSDEQMRVLDLAIRCGINRGTTEETTLVSLFNDLKKLIKL